MKLTLYQVEYSPYVIPIRVALKACGVPFRIINVPEQDRTLIIKASKGKYYQVPFLMHGKRAVYESGADTIDVARYVDRIFAKGRLFPADKEGLQTILIPHIEGDVEMATFKLMIPHHIADMRSLVERVNSQRFRERRFGRGCLQQWIADAPAIRRQAAKLLQPFDQMVKYTPFLLGDAPVYTDYALLGVLGIMTYGGYEPFPQQFKALAAWQKRLLKWRF